MTIESVSFNRRIFFKALGSAVLLGASLPSMAQLHVDITGVGASQFPISILPFEGNAEVPQDIAKIVGEDLVRSGAFRLIQASESPELDKGCPDFSYWQNAGADAFVTGSCKRTADGRYEVKFQLFDSVRKEQTEGGEYLCPEADLRLTAHRIADRIYEKITGEVGVFATRIAYVNQLNSQSYHLVVADSDGQNPKVALRSREPIISPAWSPTGSQLAYVSFETGKPVVYTHDLGSGQRRAVANFRGNNSAPAYSPDGRMLAVALSRDGLTRIYLMDSQGGNVRAFTEGGSIDTEPAFSPDGSYIYFTSDRGGNPQIYRKPVAGGPSERVSFGSNYAVSPAVSPKGNMVTYIVREGNSFKVMQQDLSTGAEIPLSQVGKNESPSYSPNGNLVVYASEIGGRGVLSTVSADGRARTRLTGIRGDIREPAWGPKIN